MKSALLTIIICSASLLGTSLQAKRFIPAADVRANDRIAALSDHQTTKAPDTWQPIGLIKSVKTPDFLRPLGRTQSTMAFAALGGSLLDDTLHATFGFASAPSAAGSFMLASAAASQDLRQTKAAETQPSASPTVAYDQDQSNGEDRSLSPQAQASLQWQSPNEALASGTSLPIMSFIGFGLLVGGIWSARKTH